MASDLRGYLDGIDAEPGRLEAVEERLDAFDRLTRKHGGSIEAVLEHAERCRTEIERLENAEEIAAELEARIAAAQAAPRRARRGAQRAARKGGRGARRAGRRRARRAGDGGRAGSRSRLEPHPDGFGPNGAETVELQVATNPGMPTSPLKDAASGGELSRIMLALSGLAAGEAERTLVFDEIDAGIGGNTARAVGERLRDLAEGRQVICITHLPQVASLAPDPLPDREARRRRRDHGDGRAGRRRRAGRRDRPHARRRPRRLGRQPPRARAAQGCLSRAGARLRPISP